MPSLRDLNNMQSLVSSENHSGNKLHEDNSNTQMDASTLYNRKGSENSYAEQNYMTKGRAHLGFLHQRGSQASSTTNRQKGAISNKFNFTSALRDLEENSATTGTN